MVYCTNAGFSLSLHKGINETSQGDFPPEDTGIGGPEGKEGSKEGRLDWVIQPFGSVSASGAGRLRTSGDVSGLYFGDRVFYPSLSIQESTK